MDMPLLGSRSQSQLCLVLHFVWPNTWQYLRWWLLLTVAGAYDEPTSS